MLAWTLVVCAAQVIGSVVVLVINGSSESSCNLRTWLFAQAPLALVVGLLSVWAHRKIQRDDEGHELKGQMARMRRGCDIFL